MKIQKSKQSYQESALDEFAILQDLGKNEKNEAWLKFVEEFNSQE